MRFELTDGETFEIPDDLWVKTGMASFHSTTNSYRYKPDAQYPDMPVKVVPLSAIKPVHRLLALDFDGFRVAKLVPVLEGIASSQSLEPVRVWAKRDHPYEYALFDGFHRFHASVAAGFTKIPVVIAKWGIFEVYDQ